MSGQLAFKVTREEEHFDDGFNIDFIKLSTLTVMDDSENMVEARSELSLYDYSAVRLVIALAVAMNEPDILYAATKALERMQDEGLAKDEENGP